MHDLSQREACFFLAGSEPVLHKHALCKCHKLGRSLNKFFLQVKGSCFANLSIISNSVLRFLVPKGFADPAEGAKYAAKRQSYLQVYFLTSKLACLAFTDGKWLYTIMGEGTSRINAGFSFQLLLTAKINE